MKNIDQKLFMSFGAQIWKTNPSQLPRWTYIKIIITVHIILLSISLLIIDYNECFCNFVRIVNV